MLREKGHWETQIKSLGGPDFGRIGPRMLDHEGKEVPGNRGYKYFGAAKDLPGVFFNFIKFLCIFQNYIIISLMYRFLANKFCFITMFNRTHITVILNFIPTFMSGSVKAKIAVTFWPF